MKSLRQVWAAAQGNPRNPKIAKRFKRNANQGAKRPLILLPLLQAAAKRRLSLGMISSSRFGIEVTRPLCGIQRDGNRKSQGALARLCEFPGRFRFTALKGRNKVAPFRLGCSASLSRPQGALGFDPPLNPLGTP